MSLFSYQPIADPQQLSEALFKKNGTLYVKDTPFMPTQYAFEPNLLLSCQGSTYSTNPPEANFSDGDVAVKSSADVTLRLRTNTLTPNSIFCFQYKLPIPLGSQNIYAVEIGTVLKTSMIGASISDTITAIITAFKANVAHILAGTTIPDTDGYVNGFPRSILQSDLKDAFLDHFNSAVNTMITVSSSTFTVTLKDDGVAGDNHHIKVFCRPSPVLPEIDIIMGAIQQPGWLNAGLITGLEFKFDTAQINAPIINQNININGIGLTTATAKVDLYGTMDYQILSKLSNSTVTNGVNQSQLILGGRPSTELENGVAALFAFDDNGYPGYVLLNAVTFSSTALVPNPAAITATNVPMTVNPLTKVGALNLYGHMARSLMRY